MVRIEFPVENEAKTFEAVLTENKRAVLYGICFDLNSATIKPQSEALAGRARNRRVELTRE